MHVSKTEYFQKTYPEEDCLSGITTSSINDFSVGTPCIAVVKPFVKHESPNAASNRFTAKPTYGNNGKRLYTDRGYGRPKKPSKKQDKAEGKTKAIELYSMDIDKANRIIENSLGKIKIIFTHNIRPGEKDFSVKDVRASSFYFNGTKPLIHDDCLRIEAGSFCDIHNPDEMESIGDIVLGQLKDYRYINYTAVDVAKSNSGEVLAEISHMAEVIGKKLPHRACFFYSKSDSRSVIDTVSVSFYRLEDSIAIFDASRAVGICMEIFLSSSAVRDVTYPNKAMCWRFLFCKYRDNAFSIDGERIKRPAEIPIMDGLGNVREGLRRHVANDMSTRKKLKSVKVSRGG